ncbi:related to acetate non-utilizing protein 9, mitochondrial precursor [Armillaria ostoyae]|uniref:Succinate dehydrogenase assembly factor 3 n=1 Tax=Armillaria ostoyae TaxID=47428 RepID=A0A284QTB1_ARMOS|nr:related to acetate non-utilizing protein 9, mitochondrial precursor [Armillaria ostoyae]
MHPSVKRLAKSVGTRPLKLQEASASLLPPIVLYRRLLRAHRPLPDVTAQVRAEDTAINAEFRRHREVANPLHIIGFLSQWKAYLDNLPVESKPEEFTGQKLDPQLIEKMSAEQLGQLYELKNATKEVWKPVEDQEPKDPKE